MNYVTSILGWLIDSGIAATIGIYIIKAAIAHTKSTQVQTVEKWALQELAASPTDPVAAQNNLEARLLDNKLTKKYSPAQLSSYIAGAAATLHMSAVSAAASPSPVSTDSVKKPVEEAATSVIKSVAPTAVEAIAANLPTGFPSALKQSSKVLPDTSADDAKNAGRAN